MILENLGLLSIQQSTKLRQSKQRWILRHEAVHRESPLPIRLKEARKAAGLTQMQLGVLIGMEPSSASGRMNHYEKGRHMPDMSTLSRLSEELGVPVSYFFCYDKLSAELVCLIEKLGDEDKKKLIAMLSSGNVDKSEGL